MCTRGKLMMSTRGRRRYPLVPRVRRRGYVDLQDEVRNNTVIVVSENTLKCYLCKNYVSLPPVMMSKNGSKQKCGRCQNFSEKDDIRNVFFENLMKVARFPCIFEKCCEQLAWGEAEDHERVCPHTTILCPIRMDPCNENVEIADIQSHCLFRHPNYCLLEHFNLKNIKFSTKSVWLLVENKVIYMIYKFQLEDDFCFCLFCLNPIRDKNPKYNLLITSDQSNSALFYKDQPIIQYNEREHCSNCMFGKCYLEYHKYSKVYNQEDKYENIRTSKIGSLKTIQMLNSEIFNVTITIKDEAQEYTVFFDEAEDSKGPNQVHHLKDTGISFESNNTLFRQNLECPICRELMTSPIYTCLTGHSICNVCKPKLRRCPSCKAKFGNSRNYSLEEMTEQVEMLCLYNKEGCRFIGNVERICQHECSCLYKTES